MSKEWKGNKKSVSTMLGMSTTWHPENRIMKKLQNDFTTIEQSRRLLELGLPANSANCTLKKCIEDGGYSVYWIAYIEDFIGPVKVDSILPCWSVGRLIEIHKIVGEESGQSISCSKNQTQVESLVQLYEENIGLLDFSKLYEDEITE